MSNTPLPPIYKNHAGKWIDVDDCVAHAAAVSAAKDAEIAGLRAELLREHADHKETIEDAAAVVHQNTALRADNTRLQNDVVMPLRERVRVLEDALQAASDAILHIRDMHWTHWTAREQQEAGDAAFAARAALGDAK